MVGTILTMLGHALTDKILADVIAEVDADSKSDLSLPLLHDSVAQPTRYAPGYTPAAFHLALLYPFQPPVNLGP